MTNLDSILKSRDITLPTKVSLVKAMVFPVVMYVWMWELDCKVSWALKNWCFWAMVLEKTLESPLDCKKIQPVYPKGNQSWIFIERMLKLKLQYFGHLMWRTDSFEKTLMLQKDWRREEKGTTEYEMVGWHHWLHRYEFEPVLKDGDGQGNPMCYLSSSSHVESLHSRFILN